MKNTAQITEGNKLIAEFLNPKSYFLPEHQENEYELYGIIEAIEDGENQKHWYLPEEMKFNSDWNWLIPVIEKCRESQIFGSQRLIDNIDKRLLKLDLLATYRNVLDFIEFHKNA